MFNQSMRRAVQLFSILVLLVGSTTAQAQLYSLTAGSGAQAMIGNGLPLPIQIMLPPVGDNTNFPPLLILPVPFAKGLRSSRTEPAILPFRLVWSSESRLASPSSPHSFQIRRYIRSSRPLITPGPRHPRPSLMAARPSEN